MTYVEDFLADGGRERDEACWIVAIGNLCGRRVFGMWMMFFRNVTGVGRGFKMDWVNGTASFMTVACGRWWDDLGCIVSGSLRWF